MHTGTPKGDVELFRLDCDDLLGCDWLAVIAETDGAQDLHPDCSCKHPQLATGTERGVLERLKTAAKKTGGNAVWVLHISKASQYAADLQQCCKVSGYRAYGVVYYCDAEALAWHKKHEEARQRESEVQPKD